MNSCSDIVIVTHAGRAVGGGHASRCYALFEGFRSLGASVHWIVSAEAADILIGRGVSGSSVTSVERPFGEGPERVSSEMRRLRPALCVVDGYDASHSFLSELRRLCPVAFIDDCRTRPVERECDILLNYNLNAPSLGYEKEHAKLLLGPQYALLRSDFWDLESEEGGAILIIPGASDMLGVAASFAEWWGNDWPEAELVLGPLVDPATVERILKAAEAMPNFSVVHSPEDLPLRIARSRAVICTSSVTSYEALALRKPLVVFQTADNQEGIGREIERRGLGVNLGFWGTWGPAALMHAVHHPPSAPEGCVNSRGACDAAHFLIQIARFQ